MWFSKFNDKLFITNYNNRTGVWGYILLSLSLILEALGMGVLHTLRSPSCHSC